MKSWSLWSETWPEILVPSSAGSRGSPGFPCGAASSGEVVSGAFLLSLQPRSEIRTWLQALLVACSPGAAPGGSLPMQRHLRGLPTPKRSFLTKMTSEGSLQLFTSVAGVLGRLSPGMLHPNLLSSFASLHSPSRVLPESQSPPCYQGRRRGRGRGRALTSPPRWKGLCHHPQYGAGRSRRPGFTKGVKEDGRYTPSLGQTTSSWLWFIFLQI